MATLRQHGDLGLGTLVGLDGEMIAVDGYFYQVRAEGTVKGVQDNVLGLKAA